MDLLPTDYLKAGISYRGVHRLENFPVPEAALREAVLDAIIHKKLPKKKSWVTLPTECSL